MKEKNDRLSLPLLIAAKVHIILDVVGFCKKIFANKYCFDKKRICIVDRSNVTISKNFLPLQSRKMKE